MELSLRPFVQADAPKLLARISESRSSLEAWLPWPAYVHNLQSAQGLIKLYAVRGAKEGAPNFGIFLGSELAGGIGFNTVEAKSGQASMGYWLTESLRGRGIMRQAAQQFISYAFETVRVQTLSAYSAVTNLRSRRLLLALGFSEGDLLPKAEQIGGKELDLLHYHLAPPA